MAPTAIGRRFLVDPRQVEVGIGRGRGQVTFDARIWTVETLAVGANVTAAVAIEGELTTAPVVRRFPMSELGRKPPQAAQAAEGRQP